jgi:hypothetical protein
MSNKIEQYSRIINHSITTSGQAFTIPSSNDHTDETWLSTDLYIGEIGINLTDDTIFMRTNNGIVQIGGSSSGGGSHSNLWNWSSPNIVIGSTYSANSVSPRSGYYTDLGTTTLRWKDLYIGGANSGRGIINVNGGLSLTEISSNGILTSGYIVEDNAPIVIGVGTVSNGTNKNRALYLNSRSVSMTASGNQRAVISSTGVTYSVNNDNTAVIGAFNVRLASAVSQHVHLGNGYGKINYNSNEVVVGNLAVRGISDDGSNQYNKSDWRTNQSKLRTSNALSTTLVSIPFVDDGEVVQIKAYIIGTNISDASKVYSAELTGCAYGGPSYINSLVGVPILNAVSSWSGVQPDCEMTVDSSAVYIKVTGRPTDTIQWLCTYSYHKLISVIP